eukprot:COSAG01_NODE_8145_length_2904_cov_12.910160_3_plen_61_part_00
MPLPTSKAESLHQALLTLLTETRGEDFAAVSSSPVSDRPANVIACVSLAMGDARTRWRMH